MADELASSGNERAKKRGNRPPWSRENAIPFKRAKVEEEKPGPAGSRWPNCDPEGYPKIHPSAPPPLEDANLAGSVQSNLELDSNRDLSLSDKERLRRDFVRKNELPYYLAKHLSKLRNRDIVFIIDDSGSMNLDLNEHSIPRQAVNMITDSSGYRGIRRWDELKFYVEKITLLSLCFDADGIDLIGLNRPPAKSVNNAQEVFKYFAKDPEGPTPLHTRLKQVLDEHKPGSHKVIVIATDGVPNDRSLKDFRDLVRTRAGKSPVETPIVFMVCSDNSEDTKFLNSLDSCPWVGIVDDFKTERNEIKDRDKRMQYSPEAHAANILLNWVPELDRMDEHSFRSLWPVKVATDFGESIYDKFCSMM